MNGGVLWGRPRPGRGCSAIDGWMETWSLTLREEHKLRVFENWVQWDICGNIILFVVLYGSETWSQLYSLYNEPNIVEDFTFMVPCIIIHKIE
jgi:hypothetical protein